MPLVVAATPDQLYLNGFLRDAQALVKELQAKHQPGTPIFLRPTQGATVQRLVDVVAQLTQHNLAPVVLAQ